jgi:hypothetical protein
MKLESGFLCKDDINIAHYIIKSVRTMNKYIVLYIIKPQMTI